MEHTVIEMHEDLTLGEIGRSVTRIETAVRELANQVQSGISPVTELKVRMEIAEADINKLGAKVKNDIDQLDVKVDDIKTRSDRMIGAIGLLTFLASLIPWPWKAR